MISGEDLFIMANIIFTIGTTLLFLKVIRNRNTLKDFSLQGSVLTMVAILFMVAGFLTLRMYVSALFLIPTMLFWVFVSSTCVYNKYLARVS